MDSAADAERFCCHVTNKHDGKLAEGTGVLIKFTSATGGDVKPEDLSRELLGLLKAGELETTWAILTCHSIIPGECVNVDSTVQFKGLSRPFKLHEITTGSVSCCGKQSVIGPGEHVLRTPHINQSCTIGLNFTLFFLAKKVVEKLVKDKSKPKLTPVAVSCDPQVHLSLLKDILNTRNHQQAQAAARDQCAKLALYCSVNCKKNIDVQKYAIAAVNPREELAAVTEVSSLQDKLSEYASFSKLKYTLKDNAQQADATDSQHIPLSGGAILHTKEDGSLQMVGFRMKKEKDDLIWCSLYAILQLLKGTV